MTIDKAQLKALIDECRYGVAGKGPAIEVANDLLNDSCSAIESLLAEVDRLCRFERLCDGITQDHIDGGWSAKGISAYCKLVEVERDQLKAMKELAEEARDLYAADKKRLMLALNDARAEAEALRKRVADDERKLDALLSHCDDGECVTCGQIICPRGDGMHFHHDGCPSCAQADEDMPDDIPDFTPGNGNKARRRAEELGIDYDAAVKKEAGGD